MCGGLNGVGGGNNAGWGDYNVTNNRHVDKPGIEDVQYDTSILKDYPPETHHYEAVTLGSVQPAERGEFLRNLLKNINPPVADDEPIIIITPKAIDHGHALPSSDKNNLILRWRNSEGAWETHSCLVDQNHLEFLRPDNSHLSDQLYKESLAETNGNNELTQQIFLKKLLEHATRQHNTTVPNSSEHNVDTLAQSSRSSIVQKQPAPTPENKLMEDRERYDKKREYFENHIPAWFKSIDLADNAGSEEIGKAVKKIDIWEEDRNIASLQKFVDGLALLAYKAPHMFLNVEENASKEEIVKAGSKAQQDIEVIRKEMKSISSDENSALTVDSLISSRLENGLFIAAYKMLHPEEV